MGLGYIIDYGMGFKMWLNVLKFTSSLFKGNAIFIPLALFLCGVICLDMLKIKGLNDEINTLRGDLAVQKVQNQITNADLITCKANIAKQNEAFKALSVNNENLSRDLKSVKSKYNSLKTPKKITCESENDFYKKLFLELSK